MGYPLKRYINIFIKSCIIVVVVFLFNIQATSIIVNSKKEKLNTSIDFNSLAMVNMQHMENIGIAPAIYKEPVKKVDVRSSKQVDASLATFKGSLTGYVYNCPGCGGRLACNSSVNLANGTTTYNDPTYRVVRIVAASSNLECGTIVEFTAKSISAEPIKAIVLDRGVTGNTLDLLTESESYAYQFVGRQSITYNILRRGY